MCVCVYFFLQKHTLKLELIKQTYLYMSQNILIIYILFCSDIQLNSIKFSLNLKLYFIDWYFGI